MILMKGSLATLKNSKSAKTVINYRRQHNQRRYTSPDMYRIHFDFGLHDKTLNLWKELRNLD